MPIFLKFLTCLFFLASANCNALEIVDDADAVEVGAATVFVYKNDYFAVTEIPLSAPMLEVSKTKPEVANETNVKPGCPVSKEEVISILDLWYKKFAFDYQRIQLRSIKIGSPSFVIWCDSPLLFMCSNWQIRAGTWVEYEVNGPNRSAGMIGFQPKIKLIRKNPRSGICY